MSNRKRIVVWLMLDFLLAVLAWQMFSILRFHITRDTCGYPTLYSFLVNPKACLMGGSIPLFIVGLNAFLGQYAQPLRKTPVGELLQVSVSSTVSSLLIFFVVVINDYPAEYTQFYSVFASLFGSFFLFLLLGRQLLVRRMMKGHAIGKVGIPAIIVGQGEECRRIQAYLSHPDNVTPFLVSGIVGEDEPDRLSALLSSKRAETLIVAVDDTSESHVRKIVDRLYPLDVEILATTRVDEYAYREVDLFTLTGVPLKRMTPAGMNQGELHVKRLFDIVFSGVALLLLSPLFLFLMARVRLDSKGPVFYRQERLGKGRTPFMIYKFRSMKVDAEENGPLLSSVNDPRITPFGRFLRRYRLDELPQLVNVLKGDMSLIGPRPEREFYAAQLAQRSSQYSLIYRVRPGMTSLGMVKYGYADNVDKMMERLNYDLIYLRNQSLLLDLKILLYTVKPLVLGKGV